MKPMAAAFLLGALIGVAGVAAVAADTADPVVGTWVLNAAKSKFEPGPGPKSQTRAYTQSADGISLNVDGAAADGSPVSQQSTFKYDGRAYAYSGSSDWDALTLKRLNASSVRATMLLRGKSVGTTTRSISGHGKLLTLKIDATSATGVALHYVAVFDKQP